MTDWLENLKTAIVNWLKPPCKHRVNINKGVKRKIYQLKKGQWIMANCDECGESMQISYL